MNHDRNKENKSNNKKKRSINLVGSPYHIMAIAGMIFCLLYLNRAVIDVIHSDYVRLVYSYLPDVWNPRKFFVGDVLTRIPLNYLVRALNVSLFGYNTILDMVLGVLGLGASALVLGHYCRKEKISSLWFLVLCIIIFSLNKWEMITNGTAWIHAAAFACFYYHYLVFDRALIKGEGKKHDHQLLILLPWLITLGVAGPYCAIYSVVLILAYGVLWLYDHRSYYLTYIGSTALPLILYIISNGMAEPDLIGTAREPLVMGFLKAPLYFLKFFLASFGSMLMGVEVAETYYAQSGRMVLVYILGLLVLAAYIAALLFNIIYGIYEETWMPLILLVSGLLNHLLILVSRWRFEWVLYSMSSRYALQYQAGILGIILTVALVFKHSKRSWGVKTISLIFCLMVVAGNLHTSFVEWNKAPYRKEYLGKLVSIGLNYKQAEDSELSLFQYRSNEVLLEVLEILDENNLNIFRD